MAGLKIKVKASTYTAPSPCGANISYNGGQSFPSEKEIVLGTDAGDISVQVQAYSVPDKFIFELDGVQVLDTGYRGNIFYQEELKKTLALRGMPNESIVPNSEGEQKTFTISKTKKENQTLRVKVYAPLGGTAWDFFVGCPGVSYGSSLTLNEKSRTFNSLNFSINSSGNWNGKVRYSIRFLNNPLDATVIFDGAIKTYAKTYNSDFVFENDISLTPGDNDCTIYIVGLSEDTTRPLDLQQIIASAEFLDANGNSYSPPKLMSVAGSTVKATVVQNPIVAIPANFSDPTNTSGAGNICYTGNMWTKTCLLTSNPSVGTQIYLNDGLTPAVPGNLSAWDDSFTNLNYNSFGIRWARFPSFSNDIWDVAPQTGKLIGISKIIC